MRAALRLWKPRRKLLRAEPKLNPIVHGLAQLLSACNVALDRLHRRVAQQKLDLFDLPSCRMAQASTAPPEVVRASLSIPARFAHFFTAYQTTFWVMPGPQSLPFLRMARNSLPSRISAAAVQPSKALLTHAGTGTGRAIPATSNDGVPDSHPAVSVSSWGSGRLSRFRHFYRPRPERAGIKLLVGD